MRHAVLCLVAIIFGAGCGAIQVAGEFSYTRGGTTVSVHFR